jgi:hypothetical protein
VPLFKVRTSKKVGTSIRLEESTAKMLDRYAQFHKSPADDVVNDALEYIFTKDKDFQQELSQNPNAQVEDAHKVKRVVVPTPAAKRATATAK